MSPSSSFAGLRQNPRRLEDLYEISKLFAIFENVEQTFAPALDIVMRTLPLRSAILMEAESGHSKMNVWHPEGRGSEPVRAVKEHVEAAYAYFVGALSTKSTDLNDQTGPTAEPRHADPEGNLERFIVLPLVVAHRPPFGVLQLEGTEPFDKAGLIFVNAIANQLAIALDRDRAWRRDITQRERAEALAAENARLFKEEQHAVRLREQILAIVSHDLRNPLGAILMTADTLAKQGELPPAVARIRRAAKRMQRLIEDLLDFASIEAGRLAIKRQPEDPGSMILEALASFEGVAQEKGIKLTADVKPHLTEVYCDRGRILQVLANLVGNAIKVTAEGGHITLRVEAREHELLFAVSDDGPGIGEEDKKHLFERYWRSGAAQYEGTGLGLAIVSGIVSAHGGRTWVESELGRGATFLFAVPHA
jgi:signal transduction histidine kinase